MPIWTRRERKTVVPLSLLIGVLTLVPALAAILIAGLGAARRALAPAVFVLCALGALVPVICLLILAPYLGSGEPLRVTLFGGSLAANAWFSAVYRADAFGLYAGLGLTILVVPLLLWMAWKGRLAPVALATMKPEDGEAVAAVTVTETVTETADEDAADTSITPAARLVFLPVMSWAGVALTLAAETAALTVLFADNILWLALAWVVLAALVWGIGELGAEAVDRAGLVFALAGPVLWVLVMLMGAIPAKSPTLFDLMGRGAYSPIQVVLLALVIALAGGAYPFFAWVRRRAALATPAGLGALLLVLLPVALFAAARTYAAAQDVSGQWSEIGKAAPPVYSGIAWAILGAVTVGLCGLLALERRDHRTLLAYLAAAQVGWGLLALSTGEPASLAGIVLLLAGTVFGLGAMLAALFAGATLTDDEEPDGAGPRAFGTRFSPAGLFAWCVGAVSLIGVPLFGGFAARELISAAALHLGNLTVPLIGIAWAGDALLALALLRATAPAFTRLTADAGDDDLDDIEVLDAIEIEDEETLAELVPSESVDNLDGEERADEDEDEEETAVTPGAGARRTPSSDIRALPALIFGLLAVALGIVPHVLLDFGGTLAAGILAPAHAVDDALRSTQVGYATGFGQWLPGIAWGALVVLALVFTFTRPDSLRARRLPQAASRATSDAAVDAGVEAAPELAGQSEPAEAWQDLRSIFASSAALPAGAWLLATNDEVGGQGDDVEDGEDVETRETDEQAGETVLEPAEIKVDAAAPASLADDATSAPVDPERTSPPRTSRETSSDPGGAQDDDTPTSPAAPVTTSQPATPSEKPVTPAAKTGSSSTNPASSGTSAAKPASGARPNTNMTGKPTTKPAPAKAKANVSAKGGKSGGKKHLGGRP